MKIIFFACRWRSALLEPHVNKCDHSNEKDESNDNGNEDTRDRTFRSRSAFRRRELTKIADFRRDMIIPMVEVASWPTSIALLSHEIS